jgi:2-polyprenyl-6-methoxyphenol hydroxylase-like FAD-dependent oxidoreductase
MSLIKSLYGKINDKNKVVVGKRVVRYDESEEGVEVFADDGSSYQGTILVGADGIHSTVRALMRDSAEQQSPGSGARLATTNEGTLSPPQLTRAPRNWHLLTESYEGKPGFLTEWKCLFGVSRTNDKECLSLSETQFTR